MQFMPPRLDAFPMLRLAYDSLKNVGCATIVYNAANEVAVDLFRKNKISCGFPQLALMFYSFSLLFTDTAILHAQRRFSAQLYLQKPLRKPECCANKKATAILLPQQSCLYNKLFTKKIQWQSGRQKNIVFSIHKA